MTVATGIQWCDDTINPTMGCDGCELWQPERGTKVCYAGVDHERRAGHPGYAPSFSHVSLFPGRTARIARTRDLSGTTRLAKPWLDGLPRMIFVSDMSDALSKDVPFAYLEAEIVGPATSGAGRRHRWLWLTKRPSRMAVFSNWLRERHVAWPENLWAGTSVTDARNTNRLEHLSRVGDENTTRFVSLEPQREWIDIEPWLNRLDWVIQGGQSGRAARPFELEWARRTRGACGRAVVAYFLKQLGRAPIDNGGSLRLRDPHGGDWVEWPADLRVRQFPHSTHASKPEEGPR